MIRNGQLAEMVKDVILTGNLFDTLDSIDAMGDDFQLDRMKPAAAARAGRRLPVAKGAPHIRIHNVVMGGNSRWR